MAKVIDQEVPSADKHLYEGAMELARPSGVVRLLYPKHIVDANTIGQKACRAKFEEAKRIFAIQPETGQEYDLALWGNHLWADRDWGVITGPRGRDWWYLQATIEGKWYYTYFMEETLIKLHASEIPAWNRLYHWCLLWWGPVYWGEA